MEKIAEGYCQGEQQFFCGNGQNIREALLRQAVKSCDFYATDIVIFFRSAVLNQLLEKEVSEISIWFRNMGVDWDQEPEHWRYRMKLLRVGDHFILFGEYGNS